MVEKKSTRDMLGRSGLISVAEAMRILRSHLQGITTSSTVIPLPAAFDRVLAQAVISPEDLPGQARSTMDGFAVRATDTFGASESMPCYLNITGEVLMGTAPAGQVKKGCCYKIPTGGLLPEGADSVVMLEHTVPVDNSLIEIIKGVGSGTNLIQKGEDIAQDAQALAKGHLLRPQDIGLLAGLGITEVQVREKVRVGILSTGDEIIAHTKKPQPGQIRNINSLALAGMVQRCGGVSVDYGIVSDQKDIFMAAITRAVAENDIVLFSGGSSVGVKDLGEQVIAALGPPGILVHGVTLKPGKPVLIGMGGTTPIFGLPGHPVSAMVCFDFFVGPAIRQLSGQASETELPSPCVLAALARNINSAPGRRDVVRVKLHQEGTTWIADPVLGKSGSISTLSRSDGYFLIDEDSQGLTEHSVVKVYLFQ
ncbi:molybdopterin molybdotransferase MoeA [Desulfopila sp. IMCC35006]|uniref:molybdopterin molybdotransferase MoeA n=1 Tax=Desulfopila sp. IMCC35006 TaxID=2569542 RepID=UPI0010AD7D24|nr:gephyrin-like molybdotransferase Glp [Desulfopila sp. IMCC35006]TKB25964.1 molybdopterin molybdotransferase MoeA [Desulfopila sp. IMCC35006]